MLHVSSGHGRKGGEEEPADVVFEAMQCDERGVVKSSGIPGGDETPLNLWHG